MKTKVTKRLERRNGQRIKDREGVGKRKVSSRPSGLRLCVTLIIIFNSISGKADRTTKQNPPQVAAAVAIGAVGSAVDRWNF